MSDLNTVRNIPTENDCLYCIFQGVFLVKHIFIINPRAGKRDQTSRVMQMADGLRKAFGLDCSCLLTQRPGHARELARRAAEDGDVRVYACGGDGTASEVANGLAGCADAAMSCIPIGTGNDFLKNFGDCAPLFSQAENLWDGPQAPLDLIECCGRYCLTIACTGIDARVAADVHRYGGSPLLSGRGSYLAAVAANFLFRDIGQQWTVSLDGETFSGEYALAAVCNGRYYGGGSTPVPEARMDDEVLNTILIRNVSRPTFARLFSDYSAGRYWKFPQLARVSSARSVRIRSDRELTVCLDGETFSAHEFTAGLAPCKINFFGPAGWDCNRTAAPSAGESFTKTS